VAGLLTVAVILTMKPGAGFSAAVLRAGSGVPHTSTTAPGPPPLPDSGKLGPLNVGDCAMIGPDVRRIGHALDPNQDIPFAAMKVPCLVPGTFLLVSTTHNPGCNAGYIGAPDEQMTRIDCLTLAQAPPVGQCAGIVGSADTPVPLLLDCGPDSNSTVTAVLPSGSSGVYACPHPDYAFYIGPYADQVACFAPPTGNGPML